MKSYHHGNLKKELIICACKLCEKDGYTNLSIRSLAKESGVSQSAPYRHFSTKSDLYAAVAVQGFSELGKACHMDPSKKITKKKLVETGRKYIEFGLNSANTYDLMFGTAVGSFSNYPDLLISANATYDNFRLSFKKLANDSEEVISHKCIILWSMLHGLVGILRKVRIAGESYKESEGPMAGANMIAKNLDAHLDIVLTNIIKG